MLTVAIRLDGRTFERCGVIPWCEILTAENHRKKYFLLAKDSRTGELGDFGGGVKNKETPLTAAFRELLEESRGVLKEYISFQELPYSPTVSYKKSAIIFCKISPITKKIIRKKFCETVPQSQAEKEIGDVRWVTEKNLFKLIKKEKRGMWRKIREILGSVEYSVLKDGFAMF
jgi:8-oxo-dGTP pyrophosphatase MutT (NUDIX family)